jgi:hypothetical protein
MKYLEFVLDSPFNRGNFIPEDRLQGYVTANLGKVMYMSYYAFDKQVLEYVKQMNSLSGYRGKRYFNKTIIDIDGESSDLKTITNVTAEIVQYLIEYNEIEHNNVQIWFSGGKGYHLHLPNVFGFEDSENLPFTATSTFKSYFSKWNDYVDTAPLSATGLIRAPYSAHKSGLHKTPISYNQFIDMCNSGDVEDYLHAIAGEKYIEQRIEKPMDNRDNDILKEEVIEGEVKQNWHQLNDYDNPSSVVTCMQKLVLRGPVSGRRHKDILRLVSAWRRHGIVASMARVMILTWLDMPDNSPEAKNFTKIVESVYKGEYSYGCKDEVMTEFCDSNCIFYKNKDFVLEVNDANKMTKNLVNYLQKVEYSGINILGLYNQSGEYKFVPGEIMVVTGDTGAGKSALVQDMLCKINQKTLYLNLEMHESLVYRRFLQNKHNKTKEQILNMVKQGEMFDQDLDFIDMLSQCPEITTISRLVGQKDYKFVVVDTSDGIQVDKAGNNEFVKLGMIIETFREIAQNKDIQVILIHHLKKRDDPNAPIQLNDLSGNRANVTKMDHVFALEGIGQAKRLRSLKNRDQGELNINLNFDYNVFRFNFRYD